MEKNDQSETQSHREREDVLAQPPSASFLSSLQEEITANGGEWIEGPEYEGSAGRTMFDLPNSKDNVVSVLLPREKIGEVPSQSLVRIKSLQDGREYQGIVIEGPFHEPDGLRADAPIVVTTTVRGTTFLPKYHGRIQVEIIGEIVNGAVLPPRFRPLPNSPAFVLSAEETATALRVHGDITLGVAIGHENIEVQIPSQVKSVLPRHVGVLGTTGGGKSTTVSGQIMEYQKAGIATILLDTEGEYTEINEPTNDPNMLQALKRRNKEPKGVAQTHLYHLIGRETSNPNHPRRTQFSLQFANLSPHAVMEVLEFNEAQQQRYLKAYDLAIEVLKQLKIYPTSKEEETELLELDELESGYPKLTLEMMYDMVSACAHIVADEPEYPYLQTKTFYAKRDVIMQLLKSRKSSLPADKRSWRIIQGRLGRLLRLKIFDNPAAKPLNYEALTKPGEVSIIDLSDTDSPQINNLVIAELLRGVLNQQEENYRLAEEKGKEMHRVMIVIEEAHEFLSEQRIKQMPVLFQQVARIARRGRKRWLGLVFVTQLPQHLPDEVLSLINSYVLHKMSDAKLISRLKKSIGGVDEGLWNRLPNLAPGQAVVTAPSLARALLVAIDPTPCRLRMVE
ncbi:ATP-binding protein [candidate division KSB1 bacterium]|nr:ATP-binding protein [candidate division KSB1 bacterium]